MNHTTEQCKETTVRHGTVFRCEGLRGHQSEHFNGDLGWWPNKPNNSHSHYLVGYMVAAIVTIVAVVIFAWLIFGGGHR